MAWGSAAEASAAVLPGSAGSLHRSDPHLRLPAPPVRCANRLHTGSPHRLLGGQYTMSACFCSRPHVKSLLKVLRWACFCLCVLRPSTSHPCLKVPDQISLLPRPWTPPCHLTTPSAKPHPPRTNPCL